jgi:PAS domain S-box-containing protein
MASTVDWRTETEFLVRSFGGIVWEADPETIQFTYVSEDAEQILGYPREEWISAGFWADHIHPEDRKWVLDERARGTASGEPHEFEYRMIGPDGRSILLRDTVFVDTQHGEPKRLRGILVDISDHTRWGAEPYWSETLRDLLDDTPRAAIFRFGTIPYRCEYMNPAVTAITGYTPEEYYADPLLLRKIVHPEDQHLRREPALTEASGEPVVLRMIRKDSRVVWIERRDVGVYDDRGHVVAVEGILRDISDRIGVEARLKQAHKLETFGRLAAGAAHDVNNMLAVILGHCAIALAQTHQEDPARRRFERINEAGEKAALFTRGIAAFCRGKLTPTTVSDLSAVVAGMEGLLTGTVGPNIQMIYDLEADAGRIKTHLGEIEQVVLNLVVNAHEAISGNGTITVSTFADGPYATLLVADTGSGIPAHQLKQIFEPFFTTRKPGAGLGLATVYEAVKRTGGDISVQSQPGRGTTFRVLFPRVKE